MKSVGIHQHILKSSFRDPAGFVFRDSSGQLLRHINKIGLEDFDAACSNGLYDHLIKNNLLIPHKIINKDQKQAVIQPSEIFPITYSFEWSFSMLKDAALLTLSIQKAALEHNMTLKDASAYNIQFYAGKPILIDTLSFESYTQGEPWVAYGQFCRHFLAPLTLMSYTDIRLGQISRDYIDGIPLDLTVKLLPRRARLKPSLFINIFAHSKAQSSKANQHKKSNSTISKTNQLALIDNLERSIKKLKPRNSQTEWKDYYSKTNYNNKATKAKRKLIKSMGLKIAKLDTVLDLGGNDGHYSRVFAELNIDTICADIDPFAVEFNYQKIKNTQDQHLMPIIVDIINPGGGLGWANEERDTIVQRLQVDLVMALALIHHLAISNNLPFDKIASYFRRFGKFLLIEFVPKDDSQVIKLLSTRRDVFTDYNQLQFENEFKKYYKIINSSAISGSKRTLYLMQRIDNEDKR